MDANNFTLKNNYYTTGNDVNNVKPQFNKNVDLGYLNDELNESGSPGSEDEQFKQLQSFMAGIMQDVDELKVSYDCASSDFLKFKLLFEAPSFPIFNLLLTLSKFTLRNENYSKSKMRQVN